MEEVVRNQIREFLASKGLRKTTQRDAIIEAAFSTDRHYTADELLDMARTTVNLVGNCLATVVMARWEGEFKPAGPEG